MWKKFLKNLKFSESYISMTLGLLVVIVIGILLFNFFTGRGKPGSLTTGENQTQQEQSATESLPTTHTVTEGESLWTISEKYFKSGFNWVDIATENNLSSPDYLEVGQVLTIPKAEPILPETGLVEDELVASSITKDNYTVVEGDDLWNIAVRAYGDGYKWSQIAQANKLENPDVINAGNVLILPR
ncbi:MAG: LysM peptidoglycan-binding domain-containing protein [Candidatus Gottesmanbacteria bacterium]